MPEAQRSPAGSRRLPGLPPAGRAGRAFAGPPAAPPGEGAPLGIERDGYRLLLFLLIIVAVSQIHNFLGLAAFRPAFVLAAGTLAYAVLHPGRLNRPAMFRTWPTKVMLALGLLACISVPFGMSVGGSATFLMDTYAKTLIIAFLLVLAIRHARDLYTLVLAYVLSCAWLVLLSSLIVGISKEQALSYTSYDPNDVGLVILMGLPLALALFQSATSQLVRLLSLFTILGVGATIAISGSRGGFLGILAVGLALLVLVRGISVAKRVAFVAVASIGVLIAAPEGYWGEMQTITDPEDYNLHTDYGRKAVWERGIGYMLSDPLTGIGIGNYPRAEGLLAEPVTRYQETGQGRIKWSAAHNSFLQPGAEMGFPGLFLFAALVFGGLISMYKLRKRLPPGWARGDPQERFLYHMALYLPVSFLAFAVTGFFLSFAYIEPIYILAAFVAGMYASVEEKRRENAARGFAPGAPSLVPRSAPRPPGWRVRGPGGAGTAARVPGAVHPVPAGVSHRRFVPKR